MKKILLKMPFVFLGSLCFLCFPLQNKLSLEESAENYIIIAKPETRDSIHRISHGPPSLDKVHIYC